MNICLLIFIIVTLTPAIKAETTASQVSKAKAEKIENDDFLSILEIKKKLYIDGVSIANLDAEETAFTHNLQCMPVENHFKKDPEKSTNIHTIDKSLRKIVSGLPDGNLKNGLLMHFNVISLNKYSGDGQVGGANTGLLAYNRHEVTSHDCFAKLATEFYDDINLRSGAESSAPQKKPSLIESAGYGRFRNQPQGWVWDLALKKSRGNPNLALAFIGLCGHDDEGENIQWFDKSANGVSQNYAFQQRINKVIKVLNEMLLKTDPSTLLYRVLKYELADQEYILAIVRRCRGYPRPLMCPDKSQPFYAPNGLGENVDISEPLKKKIISVQAPTKGGQVLPAKYYHVYGAAALTCQMINWGVPAMSPG
jgi:hypothetical protein